MKRILSFLLILFAFFLSGCSWFEVNKGIDDTETLMTIRDWLDDQIPDIVINDIELPTTYPTINSTITWTSSHEKIISKEGEFNPPSQDTNVILTAKITLIGSDDTENSYRTYTKTVKAMVVDEEADNEKYLEIIASLNEQIPSFTTQNINLPSSHNRIACTITWTSSNINVINHDGTVYPKLIPSKATLTATITLPNTREFTWKKEVTVNSVNNQEDLNKVATIKSYLDDVIPKIVTENITLPTKHPTIGSTITWKSSDENILSSNGIYGNITKDTTVYLSATIVLDNQYIFTHTLSVTVKINDELINKEKMNTVKTWLDSQIPKTTATDLVLPLYHPTIPCTITWESSNINIMNHDGKITNRLVSAKLTLKATITLDNNYKDTFSIEINIHASSDIESENQLDIIVEYLDTLIPEYVAKDIELPKSFSLISGSKIQYEILPNGILTTDGKFTYPEEETRVTILAVITLANGRSRSFIKYINALPENGVTKAIQEVIDVIDFHFIDKSFNDDIPSNYLISSYKNATITWTSTNNSIIDGSGRLTRPTYDKNVTLTAKIEIPGLEPFLYDIEVKALGIVPIPEPIAIEKHFKEYIGDVITTDLFLPGKYNEADVKGIVENVKSEDIQILWSVTSGDKSILVNDNQIMRQQEDVTNITLTAKLLFNNQEIGQFNIYNLTVKAISNEEMIRYANNYIINNLQLNVSTGTTLPTRIEKYGINIFWTTSDTEVANINNGVIEVSPNAANLSTVVLLAHLSKNNEPLQNEPLKYGVNIISSSKEITPELIGDQNLYDFLVSQYGSGGKLTTDSFNAASPDNKYFNLNLSYNEVGFYIQDLTGVGYITSLRYLNISGQTKINDLSPIKSLKNLEALVANDCNISSLIVNGDSILNGFSKLYALDLSNNKLTTLNGLEKLNNKDKLEVLYLANNNITNISILSMFTNIKSLVLSNNKISDISSLQQLSRLNLLLLDHNLIYEISSLSNLKRISTLALNNQETEKGDGISKLTDIGPLRNMIELRHLYLQNNAIDDIDYLSTLVKLNTLNASYNKIENMNVVSNLINLKYLNLEHNQIRGYTTSISKKVYLETLLLEGNNFSAGTYFEDTIKNLENLKVLSISSQNKDFIINDLSFLENLSNLQYLSIPYCNIPETFEKKVDDGTLTINNLNYITSHSSLKLLDISGNYFTDISSLHKLNELESLFLNDLNIQNLEDERGLFVFANFNNLKTLSLVNSKINNLKFKDEPWIHQLRKLEYLNLSYNQFDQIDLLDIYNTASSRTLQTLYLDSSKQTPIQKANYLERFANLKVLSVINGNLENSPMFPNSIEYLNISNDIEYDLSHLDNNNNLKYLIISGVKANIFPLANNTNLKVIKLDLSLSKNMIKDNLETLHTLSKNNTLILINNDEEFIPNPENEGMEILNQIIDNNSQDGLSIDLENKVIQGNDLFLEDTLNDYNLKWTLIINQEEKVIQSIEELCLLLDGGNVSGTLEVSVEMEIYGEKVNISFNTVYNLQKLIVVTYKNQKDEVITTKNISYGSTAENLDISKKGYTFVGWYSDIDCKTLYDFDKELIDNETIYGKYTPNSYSVIFKINNVVIEGITCLYDKPYDFSNIETPTKPYYNFVGWGIFDEDQYYRKREDAIQDIVAISGTFKFDRHITLSPVWSNTDENYNYISNAYQLANMDIEDNYKLIDDI
ncbi:MAG TPA: hypothetical protein GXZ48_06955, partial [Acholeplasmataceae bacterium]|nr:hypothetical protein [Acholeplasmataceae bacterium]